MTTAQGGDKPLGQFKQLTRWASHYTHWFMVFALFCSIASSFVDGVLSWIFLPLGLLWMLASWGDRVHLKHWDCPKCVDRAPIFDGQERAEKHINALRLLHTKKWLIWTFVLGYASLIGLPFLVAKAWEPFTVIPWYLTWSYVSWAGIQHRDLQRWCPWCRRGRDDDGPVEVVPPTPVAENTR
jgi:hypothetical protein